jgi:hypothetical protein
VESFDPSRQACETLAGEVDTIEEEVRIPGDPHTKDPPPVDESQQRLQIVRKGALNIEQDRACNLEGFVVIDWLWLLL